MILNLQCGKQSVQFPVQFLLSRHDLGLIVVQDLPSPLLEADGHHEVDDGGELIEVQVEPVRLGGDLFVELGRLFPVESLHSIHADLFILQEFALRPPVNLLRVQWVVWSMRITISNHDQGPENQDDLLKKLYSIGKYLAEPGLHFRFVRASLRTSS